jgi:endonuclease/exonuclease/phosphatase family metal-dependent hydrolase
MIMLHAVGPGYAFVGHGRDAHRAGEACPIFYDTERLQLLDWSQTALSDRPDEPASRTWGNPLNRILVTAAFRDHATGIEFVAMNTHLDPFSRRSRIRSARHIREWAALQTTPVIVTGDLNSRPGSTPLCALLDEGALRDTWDTASARLSPEWGTLGRYRPARANGRRLDFIVVSRTIEVERVGIDALPVDGGWPSDHLPVQTVLRLPTPAAT